MDYLKYSWKAILAFVFATASGLLVEYQDAIIEWVAAGLGGLITAVVVWLKANGPKPS
jgi:hypothetical protein